MIKMIIFDIDGVITDGTILLNEDGYEQKKINLKDIDAIFELKSRGFKIAAITGEQTNIVNYFENRFPWDYFFKGKKNKLGRVVHFPSEIPEYKDIEDKYYTEEKVLM